MDINFLKKLNRRLRMLGEIQFIEFLSKLQTIWSIKPYSMIEYPRLAKGYDLVFDGERLNDIEGAIVECGSWNGGYAAMMNAIAEASGKKRHVWMFDSFEGLPKPMDFDVTISGKKAKTGAATGDIRIAQTAFRGVNPERVHLIKGWFQDTFENTLPKVGKIAYLHLDCDLYEATRFCLEQLYPLLSPGAIVIIDDYSYYLGCKKAVDEFLSKNGIITSLVRTVDHTAYFIKN